MAENNEPVTDERLRNTRAWAVARIGQMSGAEVIVAGIDEALEARQEKEKQVLLTKHVDLPDSLIRKLVEDALSPELTKTHSVSELLKLDNEMWVARLVFSPLKGTTSPRGKDK